jgi:hypothetical protein
MKPQLFLLLVSFLILVGIPSGVHAQQASFSFLGGVGVHPSNGTIVYGWPTGVSVTNIVQLEHGGLPASGYIGGVRTLTQSSAITQCNNAVNNYGLPPNPNYWCVFAQGTFNHCHDGTCFPLSDAYTAGVATVAPTQYLDSLLTRTSEYSADIPTDGSGQQAQFPRNYTYVSPAEAGYYEAGSGLTWLFGYSSSPTPSATLVANPTSINSGSAASLTWSSTNATSCTGTNLNTGGATSGGPVSTGVLSSTQTYSISCTGPGGTANSSATVTVIPVADLHPTGLSPIPAQVGTPTTFIGAIQNSGVGDAPAFTSKLYICQVGDAACESAGNALKSHIEGLSIANPTTTLWEKILAFINPGIAHAASLVSLTLGPSAIPAGTSGNQSSQTPYTFVGAGSYEYILCADDQGVVAVADKTRLCNNWTSLTVNPGPIITSCSVSPTSVVAGQGPITWTASASGGSGPGTYTYTWSGAGPGAVTSPPNSGSTHTVSIPSYSTANTYPGAITVTSGAQTAGPISCTSNGGGVPGGSPTINVIDCNPNFHADTNPVIQGQNATFSWNEPSQCAASCTGVGFSTSGSGLTGASVPATTMPTAPSTNYTLMCTSQPNRNATVNVTVGVVSILTNPSRVSSGNTGVQVTWTSQYVRAGTCVVTRNNAPWAPGSADSGTNVSDTTAGGITTQTVFRLTCATGTAGNPGTPATAQAIVNIVPAFQEF